MRIFKFSYHILFYYTVRSIESLYIIVLWYKNTSTLTSSKLFFFFFFLSVQIFILIQREVYIVRINCNWKSSCDEIARYFTSQIHEEHFINVPNRIQVVVLLFLYDYLLNSSSSFDSTVNYLKLFRWVWAVKIVIFGCGTKKKNSKNAW